MAGNTWQDFLAMLNSGQTPSPGGYFPPPATGSAHVYADGTGGPFGINMQQLLNNALEAKRSSQDQYNQMRDQIHGGIPGSGALGNALSQPMSIADQLQQQLNSIHVPTSSTADLLKQANAQVNAQYDPQINQLLRDMGSTKTRATKNEGEARNMYNALAQDATDQLPGIQNNLKAQQDAISQRYNDAQQGLQQQYDQQSQQQQSVLQNLGIQAAAQDAGANSAADQSYFQQQNQLSQNQALDQLAAQGNSDQSYMRNMAGTDKLAGENAAQDIGTQLEAYLQNASGQLEDMKGSKANALAALMGQMQQQQQTNQQSAYNNAFSQMMQMNELQRNLTNDQNSNQLSQQKLALEMQKLAQQGTDLFKGTSGMTGMSNYLAEAYPNNPQEASALSSLVASVLANPDVQMGRRQNGLSTAPITNEYMVQLLRNAAAQNGITDPGAISNAIDALLAYKGQLR